MITRRNVAILLGIILMLCCACGIIANLLDTPERRAERAERARMRETEIAGLPTTTPLPTTIPLPTATLAPTAIPPGPREVELRALVDQDVLSIGMVLTIDGKMSIFGSGINERSWNDTITVPSGSKITFKVCGTGNTPTVVLCKIGNPAFELTDPNYPYASEYDGNKIPGNCVTCEATIP